MGFEVATQGNPAQDSASRERFEYNPSASCDPPALHKIEALNIIVELHLHKKNTKF